MTVAALVVSIVAVVLSAAAVVYARQSARAAVQQAIEAQRQADAAHEELRLAYAPRLSVELRDQSSEGPEILYVVRNDGRKDLDSVMVRRPQTDDQVVYPVARLGTTDFGDEVELGPLGLGESSVLSVKVGGRETLPEFRVRISCRAGDDQWDASYLLERRPPPVRIY